MAVEMSVLDKANQSLRLMRHDFLKPGGVSHQTAIDNFQKLRAISGICADCEHFKVDLYEYKNRLRVELTCLQGNSPVDIYRSTNLGETAVCPDNSKGGSFGPELNNNPKTL